MSNPNPARITPQLWYFWEQLKKLEPTSQLGGIYANTHGYHNTRDYLRAHESNNYSIKLSEDKLGPGDKGAAVDWTFPNAQSGRYEKIIKYSSRLLLSGKDLRDSRGNYLREFYGQADKDNQVEGWDFHYLINITSDSSHLWHIHFSFLRKFVTDKHAMDSVLSILKGESYSDWKNREGSSVSTPPKSVDTKGKLPWTTYSESKPDTTWIDEKQWYHRASSVLTEIQQSHRKNDQTVG